MVPRTQSGKRIRPSNTRSMQVHIRDKVMTVDPEITAHKQKDVWNLQTAACHSIRDLQKNEHNTGSKGHFDNEMKQHHGRRLGV